MGRNSEGQRGQQWSRWPLPSPHLMQGRHGTAGKQKPKGRAPTAQATECSDTQRYLRMC